MFIIMACSSWHAIFSDEIDLTPDVASYLLVEDGLGLAAIARLLAVISPLACKGM